MKRLIRESPAKINLTLRVTGQRADGFHELESLVAQVNLADTLTVAATGNGCYALDCDNAALADGGANLAVQAARSLSRAAGRNPGAVIRLTKRIPAGAGLGGGSSNAATALILLNELWECGLDRAELVTLAGALGSDVPLFLHGPQCVIRGRGEVVEEVSQPGALWTALVLPELHCSTPAVYRAWDELGRHPARPGLDDVLAAAGSADSLMDALFNDLEAAAFVVEPSLRELSEQIEAACGQRVRVTGSGSGLYRLFDDHRAAATFALAVGMECNVRADVAALRADVPSTKSVEEA